MIRISPSVLSADFAHLADDIAAVKEAGADWLHVDIMDGVYVPNQSLGVPVVKAMRRVNDLFFDVHLMCAKPSWLIDLYAGAGVDLITIHVETESDKTEEMLKHIKGRLQGRSGFGPRHPHRRRAQVPAPAGSGFGYDRKIRLWWTEVPSRAAGKGRGCL